MQTINEKQLSNFRTNRIGGIDADWQKGEETHPYTLTPLEAEEVTESVAPFDSDAHAANLAVEEFRSSRHHALDTAVVTANTHQFDADEQSISRMANAILAAQADGMADTDTIQWSLADTGTGVMTDITLADLKEAHKLAVLNMATIWSIES